MTKIRVTVTNKESVLAMRDMKPAMTSAMQAKVSEASALVYKSVYEWGLGATGPGLVANQLHSRTGRARDTLQVEVFSKGPAVVGVVGSPEFYIGVNEVGKSNIHSSRPGGRLAIPLKSMLTGAGRLKEVWASRFAGGRSWRDLDWKALGLFIPKGKNIIAERAGKRLRALAALVKSVSTPARHMMYHSMKRVEPRITRLMGQTVTLALATITKGKR